VRETLRHLLRPLAGARALLRAAMRTAASGLRRFDNDFQPLFICGVAGSGTTLMSSLLDQRFENSAAFHESALRFPVGASLRMESVGHYGRLDRYAEAMYLSSDSPRQGLRDEMLSLYRNRCTFPKRSNIVIDKAPNVHLVRAAQLQAAFPNARFILIFRDPRANLEGLRRKWSVFREADLESLCAFWEQMHRTFVDQTRRFDSSVRGISFERLIQDPDGELTELATWCALTLRPHPKTYADRPNDPGKGLRGVVGGAIRVDPSAARAPKTGLTDEQRDQVDRRLSPLYKTLVQRYDEQPSPGKGPR